MIRVYVAGPYASDPAANTLRAMQFANALMVADPDILPFIPHLYHFMETMVQAHPSERWLRMDHDEIRRSDALVRLPGESDGSDGEVKLATRLKLVVMLDDDPGRVAAVLKTYGRLNELRGT